MVNRRQIEFGIEGLHAIVSDIQHSLKAERERKKAEHTMNKTPQTVYVNCVNAFVYHQKREKKKSV